MKPLLLITTIGILSSFACKSVYSADDVTVWQRLPQETIVYDTRPELGIGMHDFTPEQLALLEPLGIRCVRLSMYWNLMEPKAEGQYDAKYVQLWDDHAKLADQNGICLLAVVHAPPVGLDWAHKELAYERFARFMAAMVKRYPRVRYWELFNEMDSGFTDIFGANQDNVPLEERGRLYARMLKLAYPAIKQVDPKAWVVTGGMTNHREFPRGIYEEGGRPYFDIMNLHTYGVPVTQSFIERGQTLREIMRWYGDADKPLWNTEFGIDAGNVVGAWGYPHNESPPRNDAEVFDQIHLEQWQQCIEWNLQHRLYQKLFPYQLHAANERNDDGKISETAQLPNGMTIDDYGFGIVRRNGLTPRPAYEWIKQTQPNGPIVSQPTRRLDIRYHAIFDSLPAGAERCGYSEDVVIKNAEIDSLYPLLLRH